MMAIETVESCGFRYDIRYNAFVSTTIPGLIAIVSECTGEKMRMIKICQCGVVLTVETDIPGIVKKTCFNCGNIITIQINKKHGGIENGNEEEDGTEKENHSSGKERKKRGRPRKESR